jgi:L-2-hydroxyglutarate oxidase LhgO
LARRSGVNGAGAELISEAELAAIEPRARTVGRALWSPRTAVADPVEVTEGIRADAERLGVVVRTGHSVTGIAKGEVRLADQVHTTGHVINCAGLHADRLAHGMGFGSDYRILPFTGLYTYAPSLTGFLRTHVYPVPDPANPFLGVHATLTVDGTVKIGPTAIPALSREAYRPIRDISAGDLAEIARTLPLFALSRHHRTLKLLRSELPKYVRSSLVRSARDLVPDLPTKAFTKRGKPGIRAQLFDLRERRLEMDFVIEGDDFSTHVLNAVSPGWTTSLAFAEHVIDTHVVLR